MANLHARLDEQLYPVVITYKRMKNIRARFRNGTFYISAPFRYRHRPEEVLTLLGYRRLKSLMQKVETPLVNQELYVFGELVPLTNYPDLDLDIFPRVYPKSLKKELLCYLEKRVKTIKKEMKISEDYTLLVRDMVTRYGSISKRTKRISFTSRLIHFAPEIIDSVIYHELAHLYHFDHSDDFYRQLSKFCPKYKELRQALIRNQYQR